jgi:oxygen-independent coproporphyrinogen-3 oxidase
MGKYVDRVAEDVRSIRPYAAGRGAEISDAVDSIYLGGGTPSLLPGPDLKRIFTAIEAEFDVLKTSEITVECAPGTLTDQIIQTMVTCGVNRVSLGVQSFVDKEAASVARLHTREKTLSDIERLRAAGIGNINVDLIAGLPHQTPRSWSDSLEQAIAIGVPHVSIYMLEVDEDSRLGSELIAGGAKYHAHHVPDDDLTAEFYETACERLHASGVAQYEISNFARKGYESRHNLKYWTRQPYLGFGVDAHSMLPASGPLRAGGVDSLRFGATDSFDQFFASAGTQASPVTTAQALEECFFLGLRLNRGVNLGEIGSQFGPQIDAYHTIISELIVDGLLVQAQDNLKLTPRGRLLSNEVFGKFIDAGETAVHL